MTTFWCVRVSTIEPTKHSARSLLRSMLQNTACALHKQPSQIRIPALTDAEAFACRRSGALVETTRPMRTDHALFQKSVSVADRGDQSGRRDRPHSRNRRQSLAGFVVSGLLLDDAIHLFDPRSELFQLSTGAVPTKHEMDQTVLTRRLPKSGAVVDPDGFGPWAKVRSAFQRRLRTGSPPPFAASPNAPHTV